MSNLLLAAKVTVISRSDGVFVEFRDDSGAVFAVAGLEIEAAVDLNESMTAACRRVLTGHSDGAVH